MDRETLTFEPGRAGPDELVGLVERARRGDASALPGLREALRARPDLVARCGDLAAAAERAWIDLAAGPDVVAAESLALRVEGLRAELEGPDSTPLERLAAARVVVTWLQCWYADASAAAMANVPPGVATFALERQDRAHKRHLSALGALAAIRRLRPDAAPAGRTGRGSGDGGRVGAVPSAGPLGIVRAEDAGEGEASP